MDRAASKTIDPRRRSTKRPARFLPSWYDFEPDALYRMLEQLYRRRTLVPELIRAAWKSSRKSFSELDVNVAQDNLHTPEEEVLC